MLRATGNRKDVRGAVDARDSVATLSLAVGEELAVVHDPVLGEDA
jgi:hypothetical protein